MGFTTRTGYLFKKGAKRKNWHRRYVELRGPWLSYYASVHDPAPRGRISLVGAVAAEEAQAQGGRAAFSLKTRSRVFLFECEHDFERPLWVTAINESAGVATAEFAAAANIRKVVAIQRAHRRWRARRKLAERTGARGTALRLPQRPTARSSRPLHVPRLLTFVGTWNMGECEAPSAAQLCAWIPAGMDVYAISVQECMFPQRLRASIRAVLGAEYEEHAHMIGNTNSSLGYHGFIAIFLWVRSSLVRAGVLRASDVSQSAAYLGKDLVVTRAANKGGVSLRLPVDLHRLARMYSFALPSQQAGHATEGAPAPLPLTFISCHLASDSHGKTKFTKRNEHAEEMLRSLGVRDEEPVFLAGDLNYRLNLDPDEALCSVARAMQCRDADSWTELLCRDQLLFCMRFGLAFPGFVEASLPRFLPTYRRKRGKEAVDLGDGTSLAALRRAFTTALAGKKGITPRTPSYTDRVLVRWGRQRMHNVIRRTREQQAETAARRRAYQRTRNARAIYAERKRGQAAHAAAKAGDGSALEGEKGGPMGDGDTVVDSDGGDTASLPSVILEEEEEEEGEGAERGEGEEEEEEEEEEDLEWGEGAVDNGDNEGGEEEEEEEGGDVEGTVIPAPRRPRPSHNRPTPHLSSGPSALPEGGGRSILRSGSRRRSSGVDLTRPRRRSSTHGARPAGGRRSSHASRRVSQVEVAEMQATMQMLMVASHEEEAPADEQDEDDDDDDDDCVDTKEREGEEAEAAGVDTAKGVPATVEEDGGESAPSPTPSSDPPTSDTAALGGSGPSPRPLHRRQSVGAEVVGAAASRALERFAWRSSQDYRLSMGTVLRGSEKQTPSLSGLSSDQWSVGEGEDGGQWTLPPAATELPAQHRGAARGPWSHALDFDRRAFAATVPTDQAALALARRIQQGQARIEQACAAATREAPAGSEGALVPLGDDGTATGERVAAALSRLRYSRTQAGAAAVAASAASTRAAARLRESASEAVGALGSTHVSASRLADDPGAAALADAYGDLFSGRQVTGAPASGAVDGIGARDAVLRRRLREAGCLFGTAAADGPCLLAPLARLAGTLSAAGATYSSASASPDAGPGAVRAAFEDAWRREVARQQGLSAPPSTGAGPSEAGVAARSGVGGPPSEVPALWRLPSRAHVTGADLARMGLVDPPAAATFGSGPDAAAGSGGTPASGDEADRGHEVSDPPRSADEAPWKARLYLVRSQDPASDLARASVASVGAINQAREEENARWRSEVGEPASAAADAAPQPQQDEQGQQQGPQRMRRRRRSVAEQVLSAQWVPAHTGRERISRFQSLQPSALAPLSAAPHAPPSSSSSSESGEEGADAAAPGGMQRAGASAHTSPTTGHLSGEDPAQQATPGSPPSSDSSDSEAIGEGEGSVGSEEDEEGEEGGASAVSHHAAQAVAAATELALRASLDTDAHGDPIPQDEANRMLQRVRRLTAAPQTALGSLECPSTQEVFPYMARGAHAVMCAGDAVWRQFTDWVAVPVDRVTRAHVEGTAHSAAQGVGAGASTTGEQRRQGQDAPSAPAPPPVRVHPRLQGHDGAPNLPTAPAQSRGDEEGEERRASSSSSVASAASSAASAAQGHGDEATSGSAAGHLRDWALLCHAYKPCEAIKASDHVPIGSVFVIMPRPLAMRPDPSSRQWSRLSGVVPPEQARLAQLRLACTLATPSLLQERAAVAAVALFPIDVSTLLLAARGVRADDDEDGGADTGPGEEFQWEVSGAAQDSGKQHTAATPRSSPDPLEGVMDSGAASSAAVSALALPAAGVRSVVEHALDAEAESQRLRSAARAGTEQSSPRRGGAAADGATPGSGGSTGPDGPDSSPGGSAGAAPPHPMQAAPAWAGSRVSLLSSGSGSGAHGLSDSRRASAAAVVARARAHLVSFFTSTALAEDAEGMRVWTVPPGHCVCHYVAVQEAALVGRWCALGFTGGGAASADEAPPPDSIAEGGARPLIRRQMALAEGVYVVLRGSVARTVAAQPAEEEEEEEQSSQGAGAPSVVATPGGPAVRWREGDSFSLPPAHTDAVWREAVHRDLADTEQAFAPIAGSFVAEGGPPGDHDGTAAASTGAQVLFVTRQSLARLRHNRPAHALALHAVRAWAQGEALTSMQPFSRVTAATREAVAQAGRVHLLRRGTVLAASSYAADTGSSSGVPGLEPGAAREWAAGILPRIRVRGSLSDHALIVAAGCLHRRVRLLHVQGGKWAVVAEREEFLYEGQLCREAALAGPKVEEGAPPSRTAATGGDRGEWRVEEAVTSREDSLVFALHRCDAQALARADLTLRQALLPFARARAEVASSTMLRPLQPPAVRAFAAMAATASSLAAGVAVFMPPVPRTGSLAARAMAEDARESVFSPALAAAAAADVAELRRRAGLASLAGVAGKPPPRSVLQAWLHRRLTSRNGSRAGFPVPRDMQRAGPSAVAAAAAAASKPASASTGDVVTVVAGEVATGSTHLLSLVARAAALRARERTLDAVTMAARRSFQARQLAKPQVAGSAPRRVVSSSAAASASSTSLLGTNPSGSGGGSGGGGASDSSSSLRARGRQRASTITAAPDAAALLGAMHTPPSPHRPASGLLTASMGRSASTVSLNSTAGAVFESVLGPAAAFSDEALTGGPRDAAGGSAGTAATSQPSGEAADSTTAGASPSGSRSGHTHDPYRRGRPAADAGEGGETPRHLRSRIRGIVAALKMSRETATVAPKEAPPTVASIHAARAARMGRLARAARGMGRGAGDKASAAGPDSSHAAPSAEDAWALSEATALVSAAAGGEWEAEWDTPLARTSKPAAEAAQPFGRDATRGVGPAGAGSGRRGEDDDEDEDDEDARADHEEEQGLSGRSHARTGQEGGDDGRGVGERGVGADRPRTWGRGRVAETVHELLLSTERERREIRRELERAESDVSQHERASVPRTESSATSVKNRREGRRRVMSLLSGKGSRGRNASSGAGLRSEGDRPDEPAAVPRSLGGPSPLDRLGPRSTAITHNRPFVASADAFVLVLGGDTVSLCAHLAREHSSASAPR